MIETNNIHHSYGDLKVLNGINLKINQGEFISIVGTSGAGKTTLLQILGTLEKPSNGRIKINKRDITELSDRELSKFRNS